MLLLFLLGLPFHLLTPGLTVEGSKPRFPCPPGFRLLRAALTASPPFSPLPRPLRSSNTLGHPSIGNAHPKQTHIGSQTAFPEAIRTTKEPLSQYTEQHVMVPNLT